MALMLSYLNNKSTEYTWRRRNRVEFADENYAREIMQLFSIGVWKLNIDGTVVRDSGGSPIPTYTNDEITQYARVWTGFTRAPVRGNIEGLGFVNHIDPMLLNAEWHDSFPKLGLDNHYVGDGLPLCSDLPQRHFLKSGAVYILLGSNPKPHYHREESGWVDNINIVRPSLDMDNSALFNKLCDPQGGECRYPAKVVLDSDLDCHGIECSIQSPRVVEVGNGIFYEYLRVPCAYQAFYHDAKTLQKRLHRTYVCGDPRQQIGMYLLKLSYIHVCVVVHYAHILTHILICFNTVGTVACCEGSYVENPGPVGTLFTGELVSYFEAERRCTSEGLNICGVPGKPPSWNVLEYWSSVSCLQQVKIGLDGTIAIVHSSEIFGQPLRHVGEDTKAFFRVVWEEPSDAFLLDYDGTCASLGCRRDSADNLCLCEISLEESTAFDSAPTREQVLNDLHMGALPPEAMFGQHTTVDLGNGVKIHSKDGLLNGDAIFETNDEYGIKRFRKNLRSNVSIGSSNGGMELTFRNPTHMMSIHDAEVRDVQYEVDAALDQYFYHPNTAPFLAIRLAQRFGISNPSPRYIAVAATAFRTGRYAHNSGEIYGTGKYGCMAAFVAAIILDREARSIVLDADPTHGSYLEPLLRLVRVMKSLEFEARSEIQQVRLKDTLPLIGQGPHNIPDVFSFFLPEFQPTGEYHRRQ